MSFHQPITGLVNAGPAYVTTAKRVGYVSSVLRYYESSQSIAANSQYLSFVVAMKITNIGTNGRVWLCNNNQNSWSQLHQEVLVREDLGVNLVYNHAEYTDRTSAWSGIKNPTSFTPGEQSEWAGYIVSGRVDTTSESILLGRNGVDISPTNNDAAKTGTLYLSDGQFSTGQRFGYKSSGDGANHYIDACHVWISSEYIHPVDDYSLFFDASNKPIDLGPDGSGPTGRQPEHFAPDGDLSNNFGSRNDWSEVGTVADSPTSPTD